MRSGCRAGLAKGWKLGRVELLIGSTSLLLRAPGHGHGVLPLIYMLLVLLAAAGTEARVGALVVAATIELILAFGPALVLILHHHLEAALPRPSTLERNAGVLERSVQEFRVNLAADRAEEGLNFRHLHLLDVLTVGE